MSNAYPSAANNYTTGANSPTLFAAGHAAAHNAYEAKLGTGASTPVASTVLRGTGTGTTAYAQVVLTTDVSGTLPLANGGTGAASLSAAGIAPLVSPSFTTPTLGVATATSINRVALTAPASGSTLTIVNGKTLTVNKTLTLEGTDSTTMTFPSTSATIARTDAANTFTGVQTVTQIIATNNAITASTNAATIPITSKMNTVTNDSAGNMTITLTTTSAIDGQASVVRIVDFSGVAKSITWVNTENSLVSAPTTSNGSTTLPLTVIFMFNSLTTKWRCVAYS